MKPNLTVYILVNHTFILFGSTQMGCIILKYRFYLCVLMYTQARLLNEQVKIYLKNQAATCHGQSIPCITRVQTSENLDPRNFKISMRLALPSMEEHLLLVST